MNSEFKKYIGVVIGLPAAIPLGFCAYIVSLRVYQSAFTELSNRTDTQWVFPTAILLYALVGFLVFAVNIFRTLKFTAIKSVALGIIMGLSWAALFHVALSDLR